MDRPRRDWLGTLFGIAVFLVGVGLVGLVFQQAMALFQTPPEQALGMTKGKAMDLQDAGGKLVWIVVRLLVLLVMGIAGSVIANRGIGLYAAARPRLETVTVKPTEPA